MSTSSIENHYGQHINYQASVLENSDDKLEQSLAIAPPKVEEQQPARTVHGVRWVLVCIAIYITTFLYGLDTTIAADVQSAVIEAFGETQKLSWLGVGFSLGSVASILPFGKFFERFDIKRNFLAGVLLFEIGSVLCGAAPSMSALIVGRVIAGVGGTGVYLGALNYFFSLTMPTERAGYIAATGLCWGVGALCGPLIGGAFSASTASWRWAFYINLVIAAVCAPIYALLPSYKPMLHISRAARLRSIDWIGIVLNCALWAAFTILFAFAGTIWAWNSGPTIALFVVFGLVLLVFVAQQAFSWGTDPESRIFPVHLLSSRTQVLLAVATAASTSSMFNPVYFIPIYFQFVHGDSAIQAAVRLLPFVAVSMGVNLATGTLLPKVRIYAVLYLVAGLIIIAGSAPLYTWTPDTPPAQIYGLSVLSAIGTGLSFQGGYTLSGVKLVTQGRPHDLPHAIALQNVSQISGCAVTLIVAGQVFQSTAIRELSAALSSYDLSMQQLRAVVAGSQSTVFQTLPPEAKSLATAALTKAMANTWIMNSVAGAVLVVAALTMRREKLF